jgi:hypothetical protein
MEEAFTAADNLIKEHVPECLTVIKREADWHKLPPTEKQMKQIKKIFKGKQIPELTRGSASRILGLHFAGKEKKDGKH